MKLCKFLDHLDKQFQVSQERHPSLAKQFDMIKKNLGLYEVCVYELCNEFSMNDLDPASHFLKKLLKSYHSSLLILINQVFQIIISRLPVDKQTEFPLQILNKNLSTEPRQKGLDLFNEGLIQNKFEELHKEIKEQREEIRKKERLIETLHSEIQQNHLVQTRLNNLCLREIKEHLKEKAFDMHLKAGKPEIVVENIELTKNKNKKTITKAENVTKTENTEDFFRDFEKLINKEMKLFETNLYKAVKGDFTQKKETQIIDKNNGNSNSILLKSINLQDSSGIIEDQEGESSPLTKEYFSLLNEALANKEKTLDGIKEAGVAWELNRILQLIINKRYEYQMRESQINQIRSDQSNYMPRMNSSMSSSSVRNTIKSIKREKKKAKKKIETFEEKTKTFIDNFTEPILELIESADIQALRIEVPLLKEKLNSFYQESKVSNRTIDLKNKEIKDLTTEVEKQKEKVLNEIREKVPLKTKVMELEETLEALRGDFWPLEEKLAKKKEKIKVLKGKFSVKMAKEQLQENMKKMKQTIEDLTKENLNLKAIIENYKLIFKHGNLNANETNNDSNDKNINNKPREDSEYLKRMNNGLRDRVNKLEKALREAEEKDFSNEMTMRNMIDRNVELLEKINAKNNEKTLGNINEFNDYMKSIESSLGKRVRPNIENKEENVNIEDKNEKIPEKEAKTTRNKPKSIAKAKIVKEKTNSISKKEHKESVNNQGFSQEKNEIQQEKSSLKDDETTEIYEEEKLNNMVEKHNKNINDKENNIINDKPNKINNDREKKVNSNRIDEEKTINQVGVRFLEDNIDKKEENRQKTHKSKSVYEVPKKTSYNAYIPGAKTLKKNNKIEEAPTFPSDYLNSVKKNLSDLKTTMQNLKENHSQINFAVVNKTMDEFTNQNKNTSVFSYPIDIPRQRIGSVPEISRNYSENQRNNDNINNENSEKIFEQNDDDDNNKGIQVDLLILKIEKQEKACQTEDFKGKHNKNEGNLDNFSDAYYPEIQNLNRKSSKSLHENFVSEETLRKNPDLAKILMRNNVISKDMRSPMTKINRNNKLNGKKQPQSEDESRKDNEIMRKWMDIDNNKEQSNSSKLPNIISQNKSEQNINFSEKKINENKNGEKNKLREIYIVRKAENKEEFSVRKAENKEEFSNNIETSRNAPNESNGINQQNKKDAKLNNNQQLNNLEKKQNNEKISRNFNNENEKDFDNEVNVVNHEKIYEILYNNLQKGLENPENFMKTIPKSLEDIFNELLALQAENENNEFKDLKELRKGISISKAIIYLTIPEYNNFKKFMRNLKDKHEGCGKNCPHLKRFYEKLGILKEKQDGRQQVLPHKRNMNKLPKLI